MHHVAPYAESPIPLHLSSVTGLRYRTLNCMECGTEFMERNSEMMYRVGDSLAPNEIHIGRDTNITAMCPNPDCGQRYRVSVSVSVNVQQDSMPLYMQPQSIYVVVEQTKRLRYVHCLECGKAFHSISDRIGQVVDNRIPFEYLNPSRLGPIEALCSFNRCGQTWALMVWVERQYRLNQVIDSVD